MRFSLLIAATALILAACDPHAADSAGPAEPPADAPAPVIAVGFDGDFRLIGTEPFWGLTIKSDQLVLSRPDREDVAAPNIGPVAQGMGALWDGGLLRASLTPGPCSDGMSDRRYAYAASVFLNGMTLKGCGDRAQTFEAGN